jgi:hypothetical protein
LFEKEELRTKFEPKGVKVTGEFIMGEERRNAFTFLLGRTLYAKQLEMPRYRG